ncbi:hypothetical protein BD779DRAFT_1673537 [Infundibulicybe gibba]|nr:hypothetical protein BD779DRAFT_1673537 [Infundibulicybe gibba]
MPIPSQINHAVHGISGPNGDADADCDMDADGDVDVDAEGDLDLEELPEGSPEFQEHFHNATDPLPSTGTIPAITTLAPPPTLMASSPTAPPPHLESQATPIVSPLWTDTAPPSPPHPDLNKTGQAPATVPGKRGRTTYVKWTKEEDELLAEAVAKYGQKWELVQRDLPTRGYHQVRQRWLGKLMAFDNNPDGAQPHPAFPKSGYTDSPTDRKPRNPNWDLLR